MVTEAEHDLLIRREVGRSAALLPIISDLERFGYAWDRVSGDSAEDGFRKAVLKTTDLLRGLGNRAMDPDTRPGRWTSYVTLMATVTPMALCLKLA